MADYEISSNFNEKYSIVTRKIIHALSTDGRISVSDIAQASGVSRRTVKSKIERLEKELGLHYTAEFDEKRLGLTNPHLVMVKFLKKPQPEKLTEALRKSYVPQFAAMTKGDFDMIISTNSFASRDYAHWDKGMQILLSEYGVSWHTSEIVHSQLGFYPIRDEVIDRLNVKERHKSILKALNGNGRIQLNKLAKALGTNASTVAYSLEYLKKEGYIKRFTITMEPPKDISFTAFFSKYSPSKGYEASSAMARKAFMYDDKNPLISRFVICSALIGSYDFFTLSAYDSPEAAYAHNIKYHKESFRNQGLHLEHAQVEKVILGKLPIRSIEAAKEYRLLKWDEE